MLSKLKDGTVVEDGQVLQTLRHSSDLTQTADECHYIQNFIAKLTFELQH